ncbi:MAG: hypothetical protein R3B09_15420 [Nannocystaceae bacterium]
MSMTSPRQPLAFTALLMLGSAGCLTENALMALSGPDESATASSTEDGDTDGASGSGQGSDGTTTSTVTSATSEDTGVDTEDDTTSGSAGTTDDGSTSTGEPLPPPAIFGHQLAPAYIGHNGPIAVTVLARHSEGVRMTYGGGAVADLLSTDDPDVFLGEIPALTAYDNGDYVATFVAWRGEEESDAVVAKYTLDLPPPGSELYFETGELIGTGRVAAMVHLPSQALVELGVIADEQKIPRCYLRRRTMAGKWGPNDVIPVFPESECDAIDLEVGEGGELYVLARWKTNNKEFRWWLGMIPAWGEMMQTISTGTSGEEAYALAHHEGALAVCGAIKTSEGDLDAVVRVYSEGVEEAIGLFDYETAETPKHWFSESARDCLFVDQDHVILVGEAFGRHEIWDLQKRDRRFILPFALSGNVGAKFIVSAAGPGKATQSVARSVTRDEEGRLYIVGRVCEDDCVADGRLWIHDADGTPLSETALGVFSNDLLSPRAVRWSPAGYVVVASGGALGKESQFTVRAFRPFQLDPIWSYAGPGSQLLNVALTLTIGPYAEVCAGGFGASAYPAIACLGS